MIDRRDFLKLGGAFLAGGLVPTGPMSVQAISAEAASTLYQGKNMVGWLKTHGDAEYAAPGELPVDDADIKILNTAKYSELQANIKNRVIKAHHIRFKRITNSAALNYIHTCSVSFKLPYLPLPDTNEILNGQTVECGIFVWDGPKTRLDYGMAFQWLINPWGEDNDYDGVADVPSGAIRVWDGKDWIEVGNMPLDTNWHTLKMVVDFKRKNTLLMIDNQYHFSRFSKTTKKGLGWGNTVDARFQVEAISIDPRPDNVIQAMHRVQFKNWKWLWETV